MDETRVQVLKEDGRPAKSQSWMWVLRAAPEGRPIVHFHYDPGRGSHVPIQLLEGYRGYLQTDGYAGYRAVLEDPEIRGLGCWAHARRKFVEAQKALPKGTASPKLTQILSWIGKLYGLEQSWTSWSPEAQKTARAEHSAPILDKIEVWLEHQSVPPKALLGKAIGYLRSEWPRLTVFLEDGRLPLDNNGVENAIRLFALGRKSWLFSDSVGGAESSAMLYGPAETAQLNGVNVYAYFKWVFTRLPVAQGEADLDALLPWNVAKADLDRMLLKPTGRSALPDPRGIWKASFPYRIPGTDPERPERLT
jgi:transposase